jgi:dienelactone hydrolase
MTLAGALATTAAGAGIEREVRFRAGDATIAGTLYAPGRGRYAALIIVPGAGDAGRKSPMLAEVVARIRQPLVERGFAVLSYDKQGTGESSGRPATGIPEEAGVAIAAFDFLERCPEIERGHIGLYAVSHGGWVAPVVASKVHGLRAIVLVSTAPFSPLEQDLFAREHMDYIANGDRNVAARVGAIRRAIHTYLATGRGYEDARRAYARLDSDSACAYFKTQVPAVPARVPTPQELPALDLPYFRGATFDPVPFLATMRQPTIAIYGERDPLVDAARSASVLKELASRRPGWDLTVKVYAGAGHGIELREERSPIHNPNAPRPAGYPEQMLDWLDQHLK